MKKLATNQPLRTRTFVWTTQPCPCGCGKLKTGWKPEGTDEAFYPGPGHLVAHDTVEHFGNKEGWDRELVAFGATMYGRMHTDEEMMEISASDFTGFLIQDQNFKVPKAKAQYYKPLDPVNESFLKLFAVTILKDLDNRTDPTYCFFNNCRMIDQESIHAIKKNGVLNDAMAWFRRGWKLAQRLHHKASSKDVTLLIRNLTDAVNRITKQHHPKVGDKLQVSVNRLTNTFNVALA